eukprot:m.338030 g.338030  ORF g.338030 m.338030 type:complete len:123 (+) comp18294_c0_seq1:2111-2479(+)
MIIIIIYNCNLAFVRVSPHHFGFRVHQVLLELGKIVVAQVCQVRLAVTTRLNLLKLILNTLQKVCVSEVIKIQIVVKLLPELLQVHVCESSAEKLQRHGGNILIWSKEGSVLSCVLGVEGKK